jgi:multicomponent Na+:H+ antiporter subunit B
VTRRARLVLVAGSLAALGALLVWAVGGLPDFGHPRGPYADLAPMIMLDERHVANAVTGVTFDLRGFDTLGEELILFTAACGCVALLRLRRRERGSDVPAHERPLPSFAARAVGGALVGPVLVLAAYVVIHGHLTPGGGFSGGVIGAGALVLAYAAGQRVRLRRVGSIAMLETAEAIGAGGFAALALGGLLAVGATMQNFLPLGTSGMLLSAGTIPVGNLAIGIEVAGAVALIVAEFLEQALLEEPS